MIGPIVLLLAAAGLMLLAPAALKPRRWALRHPRPALVLWHAAFAGGLLLAAASLISVLVAAVMAGDDLAQSGASSGSRAVIAVLGGWTSLIVVGVLLALIFTRAEPHTNAGRELRAQAMLLVRSPHRGRCRLRGVEVTIVDSIRPLAIGIPGRPGTVVVTTGLREAVSPIEFRAVLEHERAHLLAHHGLIAQLTEINLACLPRSRSARDLKRMTHLLIELVADDAAARVVGAATMANALHRIGGACDDAAMVVRAERLATMPRRASTGWPAPAALVFE